MTLTVHRSLRLVDPSQCLYISLISSKLSTESLSALVSFLDYYSVCLGHSGDRLVKMLESKKEG